jgi:hypothetical protein
LLEVAAGQVGPMPAPDINNSKSRLSIPAEGLFIGSSFLG